VTLGSGLVWSQAVKSGNVRGRSNPAISFAVPLPSAPWQAAHADLKICSPALVPRFAVCPAATASGTQNQNAANLVNARIQSCMSMATRHPA